VYITELHFYYTRTPSAAAAADDDDDETANDFSCFGFSSFQFV